MRRWLVHVALVAALLLLALLARRTQQLRAELADVRDRANANLPGLFVPPFAAATMDGDTVLIASGQSEARQVLFLFTTTCPYCLRSIPAWRQIAAGARVAGYQAYGIGLDSLQLVRTYVESHGVDYPVLTFPERRLSRLYRAGAVPETLVLDGEGRILYARRGEITSKVTVDSVLAVVRTTTPTGGNDDEVP
jgi:peroxiredoxin